jgi:hypothetical protein
MVHIRGTKYQLLFNVQITELIRPKKGLMPLFLFLSALFRSGGLAEIATVIATPLAKPAVRTGEFLFFLFFQGLHILNISKIG